MRALVLFAAALSCLPGSPSRAHAQAAEPRALIEKAIQAQGGADNLARVTASYRKVKGVFLNDPWTFTGDNYSDNTRVKITLRGDAELRVLAMDGDNGWMSFNGAVFPFDEKTRQRMVRSAYTDKVAGLTALVRDKTFTLSVVGDVKVKETPAVAVKVQYPNMPDVQLFFDKANGLLIKTAYRTVDAGSDMEVFQEVYYSHFERFDPAQEPLKAAQALKLDVDPAALLRRLAQAIPDAKERQQIELLLPELGRASFSARQKATAALQKFGAKAAAQLRAATKNEDGEVVRRCEQLLEQIAASGEPAVITAIVRLLAARRPPGTAEALLAYYPWACDTATAREALMALASVADLDMVGRKTVSTALDADNPLVREAASMALGKDGGAFLKQAGRRVVVEGVIFARQLKIMRDGRPYLDMETYDNVYYNRFDPAIFARPGS